MCGLEQVPKDVMQKQTNVNGPVNAKMFARLLYKTATTLQHYGFYCCLHIYYSCENLLWIFKS